MPLPAVQACWPCSRLRSLYLLTLDRAGFWLDEVSTLLDIRRPFLEMIRARAEAGHGPVYFSLAWVWVRVAGESEWLLRLPSVIAWLLVVALAAQLVAKRLGEWVAVLAVLLLLVNAPCFTNFGSCYTSLRPVGDA